jgi:hypothetical protein
MENESIEVDHPTKKYLYWNHLEVSYKYYMNQLIKADVMLDYLAIVQHETGAVHIKQIMNTIGFMCTYMQSYFITAREAMRFVNELANQQEQDLLILNRSLAMVDQPLEDKTSASKHLHDFQRFINSICKKQPCITDLKRYLIKLELDLQLIINRRNEAIVIWERQKRN